MYPSISRILFAQAFLFNIAFTSASVHYEVPVINDLAHQRYNVSIAVGTPPQMFNLLLDTGAPEIWVPKSNSSGCAPSCPTGFDPSASTSIVATNITFDARYGLTPDLAVKGFYCNDSLSISGLPPILDAEFAVGDVPAPLFTQGNWGIFGMGARPREPRPENANLSTMPVWERIALASGSGLRKFSVWLNSQGAKSGSVQFGGEDSTKYVGTLAKLPLNLVQGRVSDWSVNLTSLTRVTMGDDHFELRTPVTAVNYSVDYILDTGSPNLYVPMDIYRLIAAGFNATDVINGAPYVPCSLRAASTGCLEFGFQTKAKDVGSQGSKAIISVPYSELIYPVGYPVTVPPVPDQNGEKMCYFGVVPVDGTIRLLGAPLLRSAYAVFDVDNLEIRIAQSRWSP